MFLKPRQGLKVLDPATGDFLPAAGRDVRFDAYWHRRLTRDGTVFRPAPGVVLENPQDPPQEARESILESGPGPVPGDAGEAAQGAKETPKKARKGK
jgi:hypothetical protein